MPGDDLSKRVVEAAGPVDRECCLLPHHLAGMAASLSRMAMAHSPVMVK